MSFWVYILVCADRSYYVGHTDDLELRMAKHNTGEYRGYTQKRLPVQLLFSEELSSRSDAFARERQIKGWSRKKKEALIQCNWTELRRLARSSTGSERAKNKDTKESGRRETRYA